MNIIFEYEGNKLILPVNPEKLRVSIPSQSQKVEVLGTGEVSVPQRAKLATASISSFFWEDLFRGNNMQNGIARGVSFLADKGLNAFSDNLTKRILTNQGYSKNDVEEAVAQNKKNREGQKGVFEKRVGGLTSDSEKFELLNEYVLWFKTWQASGKPARFTVVVPPEEPPQCYDFYVTCEKFDYEIRAGEDTDYYYELELLEWRDYGAKVLSPKKQKDGKVKYTENEKERISTKPKLQENIFCKAKDSIWSLSKQYCNGDWKALVNDKVNIEKLTNSPDNIKNMVIKIPKEYLK